MVCFTTIVFAIEKEKLYVYDFLNEAWEIINPS